MKRWITSMALASLGTVVMAQAPFTIVRPADGSRVREKVRILIPKDSVPAGGYVGVFLDGKLVEATVPPVEGQYRVYTLDTKGRGIPDTNGTPIDLKLVLYSDANDQPRIVDESSVQIQIGNKASIPVPNQGISLRYSFKPGARMVYNLTQLVQVASISEAQQRQGGRAAQVDVESEKIRLLYSVDNAYGDGSGLLRIQALPEKGKNYALLTTPSDLQQKRYYENQMAPVYMKVTSTGHELFGALPPSVPMFSTSGGSADPLHLYAAYPLPTLPSKAVRPGDSWASRFQEGALDINEFPNIKSVVEQIPARGEFIDVEWEQGHPCAKIRHTIEAASLGQGDKDKIGQALGGQAIGDDKISLTETIWFALDTKQVLKIVRDTTIDRKVDMPQGGFGGGAQGGAAGGGNGPTTAGAGTGGSGNGGSRAGVGMNFDPAYGSRQRGGLQAPPGRQGGPGMPPPPGGGRQGGGMIGGGAASGGGPSSYVRVRLIQTFTLEK